MAATACMAHLLCSSSSSFSNMSQGRRPPTSVHYSFTSKQQFLISSLIISPTSRSSQQSCFSSKNWNPIRAPLMDRLLRCSPENTDEEPDGHHWIVILRITALQFQTEEELFDYYVQVLASVVGSEEEAKRKMYLVSCRPLFGFGAEFDKWAAYKLEVRPDVHHVYDDLYYDLRIRYYDPRNKHPLVRSSDQIFTPINWNHRLDDIYSYHHLSRCNSEWNSNCWLIHMKQPDAEFSTEQESVEFCVQMLAEFIGREEAKERIYIVWCKRPFGFGAEIDKETSNKIKAMQDVITVLPDYAYDVKRREIIVISPLSSSILYSTFHYCPLSRICSKDYEEIIEGPVVQSVGGLVSESVPPAITFTPMNWNHRLDNIFSCYHLSEPNSKWNFDHWLIIIKQTGGGFTTKTQTLDLCIRILAEVIGSEEEAKKKIYSIWCVLPFGFGAEIDEETSSKLKGLPNVLKVLPDYAFDVKDKDSGASFVSSPSSGGSKFDYFVRGLLEI